MRQPVFNYATEEDILLFARIKQQDDFKAFEQLFDRHRLYLCRYVQKLVTCEYQAEEIVSDVFMKIWKNRKDLHISSNVKAYLNMCVRNLSIDYLRRQRRHRSAYARLSEKQPEIETSPEADFIYHELSDYLQQAITKLPPKGQHIFRLSRDEGMKYREIASELQISIKTVETHMRRSLISLRSALADYRAISA
ncbi:MAG: RNA polymerase sigma-70 factor [Bacteroidota bacterium]